LPTEAPPEEKPGADAAKGGENVSEKQQEAKPQAGGTALPARAAGKAEGQGGGPTGGGEDDEDDEDFDIVLGEAAGGKEGASDEDDDDLDIVLTAQAGGEEAPQAAGAAAVDSKGPTEAASAQAPGKGSGTAAASSEAPAKHVPAAPANSQFKWTRDGTEAKPLPKPVGVEPGGVDGFTPMMHPNPSARPIWMPYVAPVEHKDAAFPSQAKPGQPIKLPGQTRVAPDEYKEFLSLGHGELFEVDLDRVVETPWREVTAKRTEYFNYGLDEAGWRDYCEQVKRYRMEFTMQGNIDTSAWNAGGAYQGGRDYNDQSDLPPELREAFQQNKEELQPPLQEGGEWDRPKVDTGHIGDIKAVNQVYTDPRSGKEIAPLTDEMLQKIKRQKTDRDRAPYGSRGGYGRGRGRGGYYNARGGGYGRGRGMNFGEAGGIGEQPEDTTYASILVGDEANQPRGQRPDRRYPGSYDRDQRDQRDYRDRGDRGRYDRGGDRRDQRDYRDRGRGYGGRGDRDDHSHRGGRESDRDRGRDRDRDRGRDHRNRRDRGRTR